MESQRKKSRATIDEDAKTLRSGLISWSACVVSAVVRRKSFTHRVAHQGRACSRMSARHDITHVARNIHDGALGVPLKACHAANHGHRAFHRLRSLRQATRLPVRRSRRSTTSTRAAVPRRRPDRESTPSIRPAADRFVQRRSLGLKQAACGCEPPNGARSCRRKSGARSSRL
jgi:hypothetical protein